MYLEHLVIFYLIVYSKFGKVVPRPVSSPHRLSAFSFPPSSHKLKFILIQLKLATTTKSQEMKLNLEGKNIVITGSTKGIGLSIAHSFLSEGIASLSFCARTSRDVTSITSSLQTQYQNSKIYGTALDVSDVQGSKNWISETIEKVGGIDVLVANVSALSMPNTKESWDTSYATDLYATVNLVDAALDSLKSRRGNIVMISSVSGRDIDFTAVGPYGAMKAALIHYGKQLAIKLASEGVRCNVVSPGNIYFKGGVWEMMEIHKADFFKGQMGKNPMGRMGRPEEIGDACVFLASERSAFTTGANLVVDGGLCTGVQL